jgi:phospholipase C
VTIEGLHGTESNQLDGRSYPVIRGAPDVATGKPGHEFTNVLEQLCGHGAVYERGSHYPAVTNAGFVSAYRGHPSPGDIMKCFTPTQLPILHTLAREFVVCDHWFSSMPGPTWPNRMFAHAGTSGRFDDSPDSVLGIPGIEGPLAAAPFGGVQFAHGNVFDALARKGVNYRIYSDDGFPNCAELDTINIQDVREFEDLERDLHDPEFDAGYVFIEPSYDVIGEYAGGNSQHPLGSVAAGEQLLAATYLAIRNSPVWERSLLIVTWDEHGGFYDHVRPRTAPAPGSIGQRHGFTFEQLGPRVPALVISPLIAPNVIEKRPYDHAAIPATVERIFGLPAMTPRDGRGNAANHLVQLAQARATPKTLPALASAAPRKLALADHRAADPGGLIASDPDGNVRALFRVAVRQHVQALPAEGRAAALARSRTIHTRAQLLDYMKEVAPVIRTQRLARARVR